MYAKQFFFPVAKEASVNTRVEVRMKLNEEVTNSRLSHRLSYTAYWNHTESQAQHPLVRRLRCFQSVGGESFEDDSL